jgi:hypothetical protein
MTRLSGKVIPFICVVNDNVSYIRKKGRCMSVQ